jgi:hypothetical protein
MLFPKAQGGRRLNRSLAAGVGIVGTLGGIALFFNWTMMGPGDLRDSFCYVSIFLLVIGLLSLFLLSASVSAERAAKQQRASEERWQELKKQERELVQKREATQGVVVREKETIRVVVKIPCRYCGTPVESTLVRCPVCNAPLS